jgi:uncharacterized membrane protein
MRTLVARFGRRIGSIFLAGLFAILPLVLTLGLVAWVTGILRGFVGPDTFLGRKLESLGLRFFTDSTVAYIFGWLFVLAGVFALGLVVQLGAKRVFQSLVDAVVLRIPLLRNIYGTSKQLVEMFDRKQESQLKAMSVVFCSFAGTGGPGVLALMPSPERFHLDGRDYHIIIIPTAPVPFGGGLLFIPVEQVRPASISLDAMMSIYVSMGVTTPQFLGLSTGSEGVPPEHKAQEGIGK